MAITIPDNATEATRELFQEAARLSERARRAGEAWASKTFARFYFKKTTSFDFRFD
jgi:hypothetical protein